MSAYPSGSPAAAIANLRAIVAETDAEAVGFQAPADTWTTEIAIGDARAILSEVDALRDAIREWHAAHDAIDAFHGVGVRPDNEAPYRAAADRWRAANERLHALAVANGDA